jgi:hypothetical protein
MDTSRLAETKTREELGTGWKECGKKSTAEFALRT